MLFASGIGGILTLQDTVTKARALGNAGRISPFFIPMLMGNAASAQISMYHKLRGPMFHVSSACASSNDALASPSNTSSRGDAVADGHRRLRSDDHGHRDGRLRFDEGALDAQR